MDATTIYHLNLAKESSSSGGNSSSKKAKKTAEAKVEALVAAIDAAPQPQPEKAGSTKKKNKKNKNKANNVEEKPVAATGPVVEVLKKEPVNAKDKKNINNEIEKIKEPSSAPTLPDQVAVWILALYLASSQFFGHIIICTPFRRTGTIALFSI